MPENNVYDFTAGAVGRAVNSVDSDPEEAADALHFQNLSGFPAAGVADLDRLKSDYKRQLTADIIRRHAPLVTYINENPRAEEVSNDDWHNLVAIRQAVNGTYQRGAGRAFAANTAKSLEDMGTSVVGGAGYLLDKGYRLNPWGLVTDAVIGAPTGKSFLTESAERMRQRPGTYVSQAEEESFAGRSGQFFAGSLLAIPALLSGVGVAGLLGTTALQAPLAGGLLTLGAFGLSGGEEQRLAAAEHGGSESLAFLYGAGTNIAMAAAMGFLLKHPIQVAAPGVANWLIASAKNMLRMGVVGGTTMEAQRFLDATVAQNLYNPDASYSFDATATAANVVGSALLGSFGHKAKAFINAERDVPPGIHEQIDRIKQVKAKADMDSLDEQIKAVRQSATFERSPKYTENLLSQNDMLAQREVGIPWDAVKLLYGEEGPRSDDGILGWVPDIERQFELNRQTGGDIRVPLAKYLVMVPDEVHKALKKDIRSSGQGLTVNETEKLAEWRKVITTPEPIEGEVSPYQAATDALRTQAGFHEEPLPPLAPMQQPGGAPFPIGASALARTQGAVRMISSIGSTTTGKALESLKVEHWDSPLRPHIKEISKAIREGGGENVPTHVVSDALWDKFLPVRQKGAAAFYDPVHDVIWMRERVYNSKDAARIFIHEAMHAATSRTLNSRPEMRQKIQVLMDEVRRELGISRQTDYGMTDAHEFVAESITQEGFQRKLMAYEIPDTLARRLGTNLKNAWDWLVESLAKMLGIKRTAFEAAIKLSKGALEFTPTAEYVKHMDQLAEMEEAKWEGQKPPEPPKPPEPKGPPELEALKAVESPVEAAAIGETAKFHDREMEIWKRLKEEDLIAERKRAERDAKREVSKEWKQETAKQREIIGAQIEDWPSVRIGLAVHEGKFRGQDIGKITFNPKFLSPEEQEGILKKFQSDKGFNPNDLAPLFNFPSGKDMIASFIAFEQGRGRKDPRVHIENMLEEAVDYAVRNKFGDKQERILQETEKRIVSPTMLDLVHNQTKMIASLLGQDYKITKAEMFKQAQYLFSQMMPKEVEMSRLFTAAGRLARDIRRGLVNGIEEKNPAKIAEAFKLQQQYMRVMFIAKLAKDYEGQMRKLNRTINSVKKVEPEGIDKNAIAPIQWLLQEVGVRTGNTREQVVDSMERSGFSSFADFVDKYRRNTLHPLLISPEIEQGNVNKFRPAKGEKGMNIIETLEFHEALGQLVRAARDQNELTLGAQKVAMDVYSKRVDDNLRKFPELPLDERMRTHEKIWNYTRSTARSLNAILTRTEEFLKDFDLRKEMGPLWNGFWRKLADAEFVELNYQKKLAEQMKNLKGKFGKEWQKTLGDEIPNDFFVDIARRDKAPFRLTREDLIMIMLNFGTKSGREAFIHGWLGKENAEHHEQKFLALAHEHLGKEDVAFMRHVLEIAGQYREPSSQVYHRISGMVPKFEEAYPFSTQHGDVGGYFPIIRDRVRDVRLGKYTKPDPWDFRDFDQLTPNFYLEARTKYEGPVKFRDTIPSLAHVLMQVIHDISYREALIDVNKILNDPVISNAIKRHRGPEYLAMFERHVQSIANRFGQMPDQLAAYQRILRRARVNLTAMVLGLNPKQLLTPATGTMVGLHRYMTNPSEVMRISELSKELPHTLRGLDINLHEQFNTVMAGKGYDAWQQKIMEWGFRPVAEVEKIFRRTTFVDKFLEFQGKGHSDADAAALADSFIRERHGVMSTLNVAELLRGNEFTRLVTLFFGFGSTTWQWHRQIYGALRGPEEMRSWERAGAAIWGSFILTSLMQAGVYTKHYRDEDIFSWIARVILNSETQMLPFLREPYSWLFEDQDSRSPMMSLLRYFGNAGYDAYKLSQGEEPKKPIKHFAEGIGGALGAPIGAIGRAAQGLMDVSEGRQDPEDIFAWIRLLLTGEAELPKKPRRSIL